jgi:hypothetical protein
MHGLLERKIAVKHLAYALAASVILTLSVAAASQPDMDSALSALRTARRSLIHANADKAGHRLNAIKWTDQAIAEVQAGIDAR